MTDRHPRSPTLRVVPPTPGGVRCPRIPSRALALVLVVLGLPACAGDVRRGDPDVQVRWEIATSPLSVDRAQIRLVVSDVAWRPRNGARVTVVATHDSLRLPADTARGQGAGQYLIDDVVFPVGGRWLLSARVETPDGRWAEVDHAVDVGGARDRKR
jgi:hypothetical protein